MKNISTFVDTVKHQNLWDKIDNYIDFLEKDAREVQLRITVVADIYTRLLSCMISDERKYHHDYFVYRGIEIEVNKYD